MNNLTGYKKIFSLKQSKKTRIVNDLDDKHTKVMQAILPYAKKSSQKNLTSVDIDYITRKTKILYILMPQWAKLFPPYNIARLVALSKSAGFETYAFDINAKAGHDSVNWNIDYDPWSSSREWKWLGDNYYKELHIHVEPIINDYLEKIEKIKPDVIGFSFYYCNEQPTNFIAKEIKKRFPHIILLAGGPQCHQSYWEPISEFDYVVSGEGEKNLLKILNDIENGVRHSTLQRIKQEEGERLNLDQLPMPDYSHFDFSHYSMPNGVNSELSRGCVAKCVFCSETHFWKYRGRVATNIIHEVLTLHYDHGIDFIWFLDSLVNGNLNELRAFCKGIIASGIKIHWTGYARCDGRMDLEYYKDLAESGCISLSYGIESGSNKVLANMNKGVTVEEMEDNFKSGKETGIEAFTNWIIGFPSEEPQDFYETILLLFRNRNNNITDVAGGHGFTIPPDTIVGQGPELFNIANQFYLGNWIKNDFTNSKIHRLIRVKSFNILLHYLITKLGMNSGGNRPTTEIFYKLLTNSDYVNTVEFETFDFNIIKPNINPFADSLVNEIWPLLRLFYKAFGAFNINIVFDPEKDRNEFSDRLSGNFSAIYDFKIDTVGNWEANFYFNFTQDKNAWSYSDYSQADSVAAKRARVFVNKNGTTDSLWSMDRYKSIMNRLDEVKTLDFSFTYNYKNTGNWI